MTRRDAERAARLSVEALERAGVSFADTGAEHAVDALTDALERFEPTDPPPPPPERG